ncbi:MAG: response regulator [Candidatus Obscuribacterales bacterium]|nr:response regulator [Candidatus Obscuribacterales bacterium]
MKVLIIDDEEDFRTIASSCLGLLGGADVVEACSGEEGLKKAEKEQPDVILLDLVMPEMDGIQTLTNMRKNPATIDIPVIFVTTKGMFEGFEEMRKLGALAVITKPFDPMKLGDQVRKILADSKASSG